MDNWTEMDEAVRSIVREIAPRHVTVVVTVEAFVQFSNESPHLLGSVYPEVANGNSRRLPG